MIRGFFRAEAGRQRPFVSALLAIPSLQCLGNLAFLVDTGADGTLLSPRDDSLLGINPGLLPPGPPSTGIGGQMRTAHVQATIILDHLTYGFPLRILVSRGAAQRKTLARIPFLLGRDLLAHFALFIEERTQRVLLLEPTEADALHLA